MADREGQLVLQVARYRNHHLPTFVLSFRDPNKSDLTMESSAGYFLTAMYRSASVFCDIRKRWGKEKKGR